MLACDPGGISGPLSLSFGNSRGHRIRRLILAFALLNVSDWAFTTALSVYLFNTRGTLGVALLGFRFLAASVSTVTVAPLVETRRGALTLTALARVVLLGLAGALALAGASLQMVLALVVADAIFGVGYRPAQQRLIPSLAREPRELMRAVGRISASKTVGQAVGASLGGLALTRLTPAGAMLGAAGVMALVPACALGLDRVPQSRLVDGSSSLLEGIHAFAEVFTDRLAWPLVVAGMLRTLVRGLWIALSVVVALHVLHVGDSGVGVLQAAAGVGAVLAVSISATQIGRRRLAPECMVAFGVSGLAISVVGGSPPYVVVLVVICGWGIAMAVADAISMSMLHRLLDPRALFRTVAVMDSLKSISEGIGALLAPGLVALLGVHVALLVGGLPLPVLMVFTSRRMRASDRRAEGRAKLVELLHGVPLFHGLDLASIEDLAARLRPETIGPGQEIVTQGAPGDRFYVIASGTVELLVDRYRIGELGPGRWFGERALLRDTARTATVRAVDEVGLQSLGRFDFLQAMTGLEDAHLDSTTSRVRAGHGPADMPVVELLGALTPLSSADGPGLERLAERASRKSFKAGHAVVTAGEETDAMYVILAGAAEVLGDGDLPPTRLHPGDVFGEIGVLHQTKRTRTVVAVDDLLALMLPRQEVLETTGWHRRPTQATALPYPASGSESAS